MKTSHAIGLVAASVLITVAVEESRISSMRSGTKVVEKTIVAQTPAAAAKTPVEEAAAPVRTKSQDRPEEAASAAGKENESEEESFAKTARKMWDNPAGKSMMNQGAKMAVAMQYQEFVDGLHLSKEEGEYFKNLLGKEITDQQELGMKMLGGTPEEQKTLTEELKKRGEATQDEIKKFLNSDDDYKSFTDYKNHLPEHQQLDGIRSVMSSKGAPLDAATETKLVDAMYQARTTAKGPDLSGPGAMEEMMKGNITETFEKSWDAQQAALIESAGKILNPTQLAAFQDYQKQAKEMQMMGLKMAEQMMKGKKEEKK